MKKPLPPLDELGERIDKLRETTAEVNQPDPNRADASIGIRMVTELVAGVGIGGAIGFFLDRTFHSSPWFFLLFFLLGTAAGIRTMLRTAQRSHTAANEEGNNKSD